MDDTGGRRPPGAVTPELYEAAFAQAMDAVYVHELDGTIIEINDQALVQSGYTRDELIGTTVFEILSKGLPRERIMELWAQWPVGEPVEVDAEHRRKDGSVYPVEVSTGKVRVGDRELMLAVVRDTTEKRELETQLLHAQKLEALGTLTGGIAHELNNILAVILGLGSLLQTSGRLASSDLQDVVEILAAGRRGKSLVENLLGFARKGRYQWEKVSLNDIVRRTTEVLTRSLQKNLTLRLDLAEDLPPVECDAAQITQVIVNLCVNAADAITNEGTICIKTRAITVEARRKAVLHAGVYVRLQVIDDGVGMSDETRRRAFDPFFTTKEAGEGTGLGLPMVHGVAKHHGGFTELESTPGVGTTVSVCLPGLSEDAAVGTTRSAADELDADTSVGQGAGAKKTVLLVDDELMIRKTARRMLERFGYEVLVAEDGLTAIEIFREHHDRIDVVLLDVIMPGLDGFACFDALREIDDEIYIVLTTGHGDEHAANRALAKGRAGILRKPFDMQQLVDEIGRSLVG